MVLCKRDETGRACGVSDGHEILIRYDEFVCFPLSRMMRSTGVWHRHGSEKRTDGTVGNTSGQIEWGMGGKGMSTHPHSPGRDRAAT